MTEAATLQEAVPTGTAFGRVRLGLVAGTAVGAAATATAIGALARASSSFDLASGGDGVWLLVDIAAALVLAGWGVLRFLEDRRDGAAYLLQVAALAWAVAALCDTGALLADAWVPFGRATDDIQVTTHLFARSVLVAAVILVLPDRDEDGFLRRGPVVAAAAGLTAVALSAVAVEPAGSVLRETPFGFGNRTWIETGASLPRTAVLVMLVVEVAALLALHRTRRGLPPTSFQVIGWTLVAAGAPLLVPRIDERLPDPILDVLATIVFPALPVVAGVAALRSAAAGAATVRRLRQHQERLVDAVESERRRLRDDLHDSVGPTLAGIALGIRAAADKVATSDAATADLLERLAEEAEGGLDEVRRIAHQMRPPALDQLGLAGAITAAAERTCNLPTSLELQLDIDPRLPAVAAAKEVALYRIVNEALTNVVRHASANRVTLRLFADGRELTLEVIDDGRGLPLNPRHGVGMTSMRERAEFVGGRVTFGPGPRGGLSVTARIPVRGR